MTSVSPQKKKPTLVFAKFLTSREPLRDKLVAERIRSAAFLRGYLIFIKIDPCPPWPISCGVHCEELNSMFCAQGSAGNQMPCAVVGTTPLVSPRTLTRSSLIFNNPGCSICSLIRPAHGNIQPLSCIMLWQGLSDKRHF